MVPEIWSVTDKSFLSFLTAFLPFHPPNNPKNQNSEKMKKLPGGYYHFTQAYHKLKPHDVWFLRYEVWRTEFFVILDNFLSFTP